MTWGVHYRLFLGAVEFVKQARSQIRLAGASDGRSEHLDSVLAGTAIGQDFDIIVSADDCAVGKPHPAVYLSTLQRLNDRRALRPLLTVWSLKIPRPEYKPPMQPEWPCSRWPPPTRPSSLEQRILSFRLCGQRKLMG